MTALPHPRFQARIERLELERAYAAERDLVAALGEIEALAERIDAAVGTRLAASVRATCDSFRASLRSHGPTSSGGRIVRRFLPDRIRELRSDCEATERALRTASADPARP